MAEIFTVETRGVGKPDYSQEVSAGRTRPGLMLKYNQQLVQFALVPQDLVIVPTPVPWITAVLAPFPAFAHLINTNTGIPMPLVVPKGYSLTLFEGFYGASQDTEVWAYYDGMLVANLTVCVAGAPIDVVQVVGYSTRVIDPLALSSHIVDIVVINRGGAAMRGGAQCICILEAEGTPPFPTDKTTQCPFCGHQQVVPVVSTNIKCGGCGKDYIVWDTTRIRQL